MIPYTPIVNETAQKAQQTRPAFASALTPSHRAELTESSISPLIQGANFRSVVGEEFENLILGKALEEAADATGTYITASGSRLSQKHKGSYDAGGWYCAGQDLRPLLRHYDAWSQVKAVDDDAWMAIAGSVHELTASTWGCFKSDRPRVSKWRKAVDGGWEEYEGKVVKYEHPAKTETSIFVLADPDRPRLWLEVLANAAAWPVIITEGAKKAAAALSFGFVAIALPGVAQWNKPKTRELLAELALFARKGREFYIAFDQDAKAKTRANVAYEISKLCSALKRAGAISHIVRWSSKLGKGLDDLLANHGVEALATALGNATRFECWALRYLSRMTYPVSYRVPKGQRFIDGEAGTNEPKIPFPADQKFYALVAPKGTGKTEAIKRLVAMALGNGQRVLFITHRVQLTTALCNRTGIPSIYQIVEGRGDESQGMGLCVQSLHAESQAGFDSDQWSDALVIIDEAEQVLWEVLNSSTCKNKRVEILRQLRDTIAGVLSPHTEGRLCLADADLSDISVDFIRGIAGENSPSPWIAKSNYVAPETSYDATIFEKNEQLLEATEEKIEAGQKLMVVTDSQKTKSRFSSSALESRWAAKYPGLKILRIDSNTLNNKAHKAFGSISMLNSIVVQYDIVICSPSVETGVSIDVRGHFDRVVGFFQGVMAENSARQALARLRDNVPRDIVLPPRGLSFIGGSECSAEALEASQAKMVKMSLGLIFDAARDDIDSAFLPAATHAWAKFAARQNASMAAYGAVVAGGLKLEGQSTTAVAKPDADSPENEALKDLSKELTEDRHSRLKAEADQVVEAKDLTETQVAALEKTSAQDESEQLALQKATLKRLYPGHEITPDLHVLDAYGWFPKIKLHYALTMGNAFVKANDRAKVEEMLGDGGSQVWAADVRRSTLSLKVSMLRAFGIDRLIEKEEISHYDADVIALAKRAYENRAHIKAVLGFSIKEAEVEKPVLIAKKFLGAIGFGTKLTRQVTDGTSGDRVRYYSVEAVDHKEMGGLFEGEYDSKAYKYSCDRRLIFAQWLARDEKGVTGAQTEISLDQIAADKGIEADVIEITEDCDLHKLGNRSYISPPACAEDGGCADIETPLGESQELAPKSPTMPPKSEILNSVSQLHPDPTWRATTVETQSTDSTKDNYYDSDAWG